MATHYSGKMRRIILERAYPRGHQIGGNTYVDAVFYAAGRDSNPSRATMRMAIETVERGVKTTFTPCWQLHELLALYLAEQERLGQ